MSAYETLLCAASAAQESMQATLVVPVLDLAEVLAELAAMRHAGGTATPSKYTPDFEAAWSAYPARPGASKAATFKAWKARLKSGATAVQMIEGAAAYAAYCKAERTEPQFIKQAATFFGPGEHFAADWTVRKGAVALPSRSGPPQESVEQKEARRARWGLNGLLPGDDQEPIHAPY